MMEEGTISLFDILNPIKSIFGNPIQEEWKKIAVTGVVSRLDQAQSQKILVLIRGKAADFYRDLRRALQAQPAAIVVERRFWQGERTLRDLPQIPIMITNYPDRQAYALLCAIFWGQPSLKIYTIGVTGTNGKTSVTTMGEHLLKEIGIKVCKIGTLGLFCGEEKWESQLTTPDAYDLHRFLSHSYRQGAQASVMEVSSHALDQFRVDGVHFDAVIFTQLTQDHLDYHGTMEKYFQAKARLFSEVLFWSKKNMKLAVINIDDPWGQKLQVDSQANVLTYGQSPIADFRYQIGKVDWSGTFFNVYFGGQIFPGFLPILGNFQVANFMAIVCALVGAGLISLPDALLRISHFPGVSGRLQKVRELSRGQVFVDFAHTPDALENTLKTLRGLLQSISPGRGKLGVVFGCGGERDPGKRPQMGAIAERLCDWIIVTNDNPRTEDERQIAQDILSGMQNPQNVTVELDRKSAIFEGLRRLGNDDVLLIAGKGHEKYQEVGQQKIPFSDYEIAQSWNEIM